MLNSVSDFDAAVSKLDPEQEQVLAWLREHAGIVMGKPGNNHLVGNLKGNSGK